MLVQATCHDISAVPDSRLHAQRRPQLTRLSFYAPCCWRSTFAAVTGAGNKQDTCASIAGHAICFQFPFRWAYLCAADNLSVTSCQTCCQASNLPLTTWWVLHFRKLISYSFEKAGLVAHA